MDTLFREHYTKFYENQIVNENSIESEAKIEEKIEEINKPVPSEP